MKYSFVLVIFLSLSCFAEDVPKMNQLMKQLGFQYKTAMQSQNQKDISAALNNMQSLLINVRSLGFDESVEKESLEGIELVELRINNALSYIDKKEIDKAKEELRAIDALRKQYHELHEPPGTLQLFKELLFGKN